MTPYQFAHIHGLQEVHLLTVRKSTVIQYLRWTEELLEKNKPKFPK